MTFYTNRNGCMQNKIRSAFNHSATGNMSMFITCWWRLSTFRSAWSAVISFLANSFTASVWGVMLSVC
uniref:Uncharacterized protein n=1 Tax=Arion vulgaris TaxID=1028688 RepID=A0A0B7B634_9EUPU